MRILQLSLNNFFSFKSADFDFRDKSDLIFVSGFNGSREFSKDDVVNESEGKDCKVSVTFSVGSDVYTVTRFRNHSAEGNRVYLFDSGGWKSYLEDEGKLSGESTKETNQKIVDLIGLNYSAYCNAVVFGQGTIKRFTQCTDSERRKILEDFLQLEIYTTAREIAKKDWKRLQDSIADLNAEKGICNARISEVDAQVGRAKNSVKQYQVELKAYKASVATSINQKKARLKAVKKEQQEIIESLKDLDSVDVDDAIKQTKQAIQEALGNYPELESVEQTRSDAYNALSILNNSINDWTAAQNRFNVGDECPSCFRKLTKPAFEKYTKFLSGEIKKAKVESEKYEKEFTDASELRKTLKSLLDEEANLTRLKTEVVHKQRNEEASANSLKEEAKRIQAEISNVEDRSESLTNNLEKAKDEVKELEKRKFVLDKVREIKEVRIGEVQTEADEAKFWMDGFSNKGVKDLIFAQSLSYLNDRLARYSTAISGGKIRVEIHRDLSVGIDITDGAKRYQTASGGQARRIDLMIGLALQSLVEAGWQDTNIKVIDEFDASLDKEGVDGFLSLLREEAKQKNAIFIISHNDYLAQQLDQVIYVELDHGESQIVA
jgi:DNA repair exonuclease SbcCD ATPase subunit